MVKIVGIRSASSANNRHKIIYSSDTHIGGIQQSSPILVVKCRIVARKSLLLKSIYLGCLHMDKGRNIMMKSLSEATNT